MNDEVNHKVNYKTLRVRFESSSTQGKKDLCFLQLYRPDADNTINDLMVEECRQVLQFCKERVKVVVIEGLPEVFCFGADFKAMVDQDVEADVKLKPELSYDLCAELAMGSYITVAHVRGKANAGGMGFVAACDIVLADNQAQFSLSELLFGLMPACVLPFLIRRVGFQRAHTMTLMTKPIGVDDAHQWGLVDAYAEDSEALLRQRLLRLKRLNKTAIRRYKNYMNKLNTLLVAAKPDALAANVEVFSDQKNLADITRYVNTGRLPWES